LNFIKTAGHPLASRPHKSAATCQPGIRLICPIQLGVVESAIGHHLAPVAGAEGGGGAATAAQQHGRRPAHPGGGQCKTYFCMYIEFVFRFNSTICVKFRG
jgi:hypothetical protein